MNQTFADTFYFLGLLNPKDAAHARAVTVARGIQGQSVTTVWVLIEGADAMSDPENRAEFISFFEDLRQASAVRIIPADQALFEEGFQLYANRPDKGWSLTDCISFVVMKKAGIREALTGDRHFEQAGFVALLR